MGYVLDGSKEHSLARGYKIFEIDTIDNSNQPLNLISDLSTSDKKANDVNKELSENNEWLKRIENVSKTYGNGTFIMDRGFDGSILMEKIIEMGNDFIIRAKNLNRYVYVNGEKTTISNLARKHKGFYKFDTKIDGVTTHLKVSSMNITIKSQDAKSINKHLLTLVLVKGFGDCRGRRGRAARRVSEWFLAWRVSTPPSCGSSPVRRAPSRRGCQEYWLRTSR